MKTQTKKRKSLKHIRKLSTLLALALKDLRKQERTKGCVVVMAYWWAPKSGRRAKCFACLAGSVMRWSLTKPAVDPFWKAGDHFTPGHYDPPTGRRLVALNELRQGAVQSAAVAMHTMSKVCGRHVPEYHTDRDGWWAAMKQLLADLRAAGE